jgi:GT2 family glycosyltransferase
VPASEITPEVSVVVPTHQRRDSVERLLDALASQTLAPELVEVVVSVDGSTDGTLDLLARYEAPYRLVSVGRPRGGRAAACNAGIRAAGGDLIVILDDDMEPLPGCLEAHRRAHSAAPRRCVVGAAPIQPDPAAPPLTGYMARKFNTHLERLAEPGHEFGVRDFFSGNASIGRQLLLEVGVFDESFTSYGNEDLELAVRLRKAGATIHYAPDAVARQHYAKCFKALARDTAAKGRTAVQFASKHPDVLPELQLASADAASVRWRLVREGLLRLTSVVNPLPALLAGATGIIERVAPRRVDLVYAFLLDYFYWLGVRSTSSQLSGFLRAGSPAVG